MARDAYTPDLFAADSRPGHVETPVADVSVLRAFVADRDAELQHAIAQVTDAAPWRFMRTPGGQAMSVAMTSCGHLGWTSAAAGYHYSPHNPQSGHPWPAMPAPLHELAVRAAAQAGYPAFAPDSCLINRYAPGARMGLHQDRNERDFSYPIVSVSLGLPALFIFGGAQRTGPTTRISLMHGDVVVWGGSARLNFHGVRPLRAGWHAFAGSTRINLTFRRAG